jgi:hypothetical protein
MLRQQAGGVGQRTVAEQFRGLYDATIYSVDAEAGTCSVIVPAYDGQIPLGPSPYFGIAPAVGSPCIVGFVVPPTGSQGEITMRVIAGDGLNLSSIDGGNATSD